MTGETIAERSLEGLLGTCTCGKPIRYSNLATGEGSCCKRGCPEDVVEPKVPMPLMAAKAEFERLAKDLPDATSWTDAERMEAWTFFWHGWQARTDQAPYQVLARMSDEERAEIERMCEAMSDAFNRKTD